MSLIDIIPIGKEHKKTRQELMYEAKITNIQVFKQEIAKLKEKYIILFDDGYYFPATKEEYINFIKKMETRIKNDMNTLELAYDEMEGLDDVRSIHNNNKKC